MQTTFSENDEAFRQEVRTFLEENLTEDLREAGRKKTSVWQEPKSATAWQQLLYNKGWLVPDWPVEHGGTGWSLSQRYIFAQECARAETPGISPMGLRMCGPMLIGYGSEEQKSHYLPKILSGEHIWCQGYSEPGAGSDLASLSTRAVSDGDDYIVNGTKIWTSFAQHANMIFVLVRTSTEGRVQQGISFLLIDMSTPGIRVEPIINLEGSHELNQVFFDDVRVPKVNRVGKENDGWSVAKYLLQFERFSMSSVGLRSLLSRASRLAEQTSSGGVTLAEDSAFRKKLAQLEIDCLAMETSEQRVLAELNAGNSPGAVSSVLNAISAETLQRADELGIEVAAYYGLPLQLLSLDVGGPDPVGPEIALPLMPSYMNSRARTIAGGSGEIQRNIVAKAILEL
ncbi:MAG: acyl-CoA dehydrogenase [Gammaproteobacteria bacterium]|jgi:alkylation response protein AidB-like acyl-CoA dehydrogenase|nr:acyl-CoA dehydrogenase [Gammaproteobacteria bacterium]MBT4494990.1 acyl-CoA dehydrogenase [Gammaproteobacteria bacterium]MBT7369511.1 acyl-CoA dehydrogenase [Gammaproteobacteria bacterium]